VLPNNVESFGKIAYYCLHELFWALVLCLMSYCFKCQQLRENKLNERQSDFRQKKQVRTKLKAKVRRNLKVRINWKLRENYSTHNVKRTIWWNIRHLSIVHSSVHKNSSSIKRDIWVGQESNQIVRMQRSLFCLYLWNQSS
jgi:hypothetical protein